MGVGFFIISDSMDYGVLSVDFPTCHFPSLLVLLGVRGNKESYRVVMKDKLITKFDQIHSTKWLKGINAHS